MTLKYQYKTIPYSHQKRALAKVNKLRGKGGLLMEMGTGKTKVAIDWACIGYHNFNVRRVLVLCPVSVMDVWDRQIRLHSPVKARIVLLRGSSSHKARRLVRLLSLKEPERIQWIVINYEAIWREYDQRKGKTIESLLKRWRPDIVIADESHRIKSHSSRQSRSSGRLGSSARMRLLLTGTPITKSPLDLFGQFRFLDPTIFGRNWYAFKNYYGVWGGFNRFQLRGYKNLKELVEKVRGNSFRIKKEQCLDLPEKVFVDVPVTLSDKEKRLYREMAEQMIIEIEETHATASIVLVKLLRLSQITSGFVKDVEGKIRDIGYSKLRTTMDLLDDVLQQTPKAVIFVRFRYDIDRITQELKAKKISYEILSGSVPGSKRHSIVERFQNDPSLKVFVVQIQSGSLGIDLTAASVAIFYSLDYRWDSYVQAVDRLHRHGQKHKCTYYHMVAPHTIDTITLQVLKEKGSIAEAVIHDPNILRPD